MTIDRRLFLGGAAALAGAPALALAPLSGAQAPGYYRARIGAFELTALSDGFAPLDATLFSGVPEAELDAILAANALGRALPTAVNAFLVNSAERTVLVDAGAGAVAAMGPTLGRFGANLTAAGATPAQVDAVILTHAHFDHCGGLIDAAGAAVFPNAELVLHEAEHAFWTDDAIFAQAPADFRFVFEAARAALAPYAGRTRLVGEGEVFPGVSLRLSAGHTAGHCVVHVASGDAQALLVGDTLHNVAIHTARPDAGFAFDTDPAQAAAARRRVFDMAAADGLLIAGAHIAFPGLGRIVRDGDAYAFAPARWTDTL